MHALACWVWAGVLLLLLLLLLQAQAKFLPKQFYKCKKPKAAASLEQIATADPNPGPGPTPGAGCSMATEKKACGKEKGCVWCEGSFGPGSCYDEVGGRWAVKRVKQGAASVWVHLTSTACSGLCNSS